MNGQSACESIVILITGGSGYVGSHLVARLVESGTAVRVLVRDPERARGEGRLAGLELEQVQGDVTAPDSLLPAFSGVRTVVHTVAIAIEKGQGSYEQVNHQGTLNVLKVAREAGVRRFINLSQMGADPDGPYRFLASKGAAQQAVSESGLEWTAFRPSVIWGPEDEFANTFARLVPFSPLIYPIVGDESSTFQPVWVEDVVSAMLQALDDPSTVGREYELGGPEVLTLEEIERRTLQAVGARRVMVRFPLPLLRLVVKLMEFGLPSPPVTSSLLELLAVSNVPTANSLPRFVSDSRPFTVENIAPYMRAFSARDTLREFFSR